MPRIRGQTDAASSFLRAFRTNPAGPPPDKWPAPAILRRWLRRPSFRAALASLQETLRLQADFHLATAACSGAATLSLPKGDLPNDSAFSTHHSALYSLLRLSHLRQRFPTTPLPPDDTDTLDDPDSAPEDRPLTCLDVIGNLHLVEPRLRLNEEELRDVAWRAGYPLPLKDFPDFPPPTPQDTFYYYLIMNPSALLWYFQLYGAHTGDHRHSHILANCKHLIPREAPDCPLPRFRPQANTPELATRSS